MNIRTRRFHGIIYAGSYPPYIVVIAVASGGVRGGYMNKWICVKCGRETYLQPKRNAICNIDGCKGRMKKYTLCACGTWFENSKGNMFCSNTCEAKKAASGFVGKIILTCAYCGRKIVRYNGNCKGKMAFCNTDCLRRYQKDRKINRVCQYCGKHFEVYKSALEKTNASGNFCSRDCYEQYLGKQEHGKYYRGDFERVKRQYFSGEQRCAICGTTMDIHIHHIIPYRFTADNNPNNLIPLCRKHHKCVENIWLPFINMFDNKEIAKKYINISLRGHFEG